MDTSYWNLFWPTGMPEAWLMSRDQSAAIQSAAAQSAALPAADDEETKPSPTGGVSTGFQG